MQMAKKTTGAAADSRCELRLPGDLLTRAKRQAGRLGVRVSAYVRTALARQVEADEATDPNRKGES